MTVDVSSTPGTLVLRLTVEVGIRLNQTSWRGTDSRAHVGDEEASIRLRSNLIDNRREDTTVTFLEFGVVRVACVEVEGGVLRFQQR